MDGERNHELLRSYLLGELPEEEMDRLEQELFEDDELFDLCEALEADLLAAYDRGELTAAEKEQVRRRLASSPAGEERLALARSLNTAAREVQRTAVSVVPFRRRVPLPRRASGWAALAAAALLVAVGTWFVRPALEQGGPSKVTNKIATHATKPIGTSVSRQQRGVHGAKEQVAQQPPRTKPDLTPPREERAATLPPARHEPVTTFFTLSLATLRGAEEVQKSAIPANAELVEIQVDLEGLEDYRSFDAAVKSETEGTVWEKKGLTPKRLDWGTALVLKIPAQRLTTGLYDLAVTAGTETLTTKFEVLRENQ